MDEQFLSNLFQTSLYFYSSLLQADAAILAFGTVCVVFKLQSLDFIKQSIVQAYHSLGRSAANTINIMLFPTDPKNIASALAQKKIGSEYHYKNYLLVLLIPAKSLEISASIKWPLKVIGLHTILSSLLLAVNQFIYKSVFIEFVLLSLTFVWFCYGIYLAASLAISLLTKTDDYQLEKLRPDVYRYMCEIKNEKAP
jgi:hypothetical protein